MCFFFYFFYFFFFFNDTATTEIYTLSLHDALRPLRHYLRLPHRRETHRPKHPTLESYYSGEGTAGSFSPRIRRRRAVSLPPTALRAKVHPGQDLLLGALRTGVAYHVADYAGLLIVARVQSARSRW